MARAKQESNVGLPAERRESPVKGGLLDGNSSPADEVDLKGSGYEKKWSNPSSAVPAASAITHNKGNGSW